MRHVGQELRLVLGGQRQLFGLLLQRRGRHIHLLLLALDLLVLFGQQLGLLLQLVVGLQPLGRQRLRLGQQLFGSGRRGDGVHDHADAFGELVEERQVRVAEAVERRQLDHRFDVALEQHRQDDDVERWRRAQAGADVDVVARDLAEQNAALFVRALANQSFAEPELLRQRLALAVGVGRHQLQQRPPVVEFVDVQHAMLGVDQRGQLGQDQVANRLQISLALQRAREARQAGLEPVLLGALVGRLAQVADHLVDGVFELSDLALRVDVDGARQVALGDGGRDFADGAHLGGQVGGHRC